MCKFRKAKGRVIRIKIDEAAEIIAGGYESISDAMIGNMPIRTEKEYDKRLDICRECAPDGRCPECNCNYVASIVSQNFKCGKGKW